MSVERESESRVPSIFHHKYKLPTIESDISRWDKAWEKALRTISASEDVFPVLSGIWTREAPHLDAFAANIRDRLCESQKLLMNLDQDMVNKGDHLAMAWVLVDESERKRHLLHGLKEASTHATLRQDARALCPEITTSAMLKRNGAAFTDFVRKFTKAIEDVGEGQVYQLPSEWWQSAVDTPEPWPDNVQYAFKQLSIQRNEFITTFTIHTMMSVLHDLGSPGPGMKKATDLMSSDVTMASGWAHALSSVRDKPLIRCQNCTKSTEEIGPNANFMACSVCKTKLDFVVHYCSQSCQKADWRNHKQNCGKNKVAKKLPGTIHDRFWMQANMPESLRSVPETENGSVAITSLGFGTQHPSRPFSQALQRQIDLLEGDKLADYFIFDDTDQPIRVLLRDEFLKMGFRMIRAEAMFGADASPSAEALAEFLIKTRADLPGFSRQRILDQFRREYGNNMPAKIAAFERKSAERGSSGTTFVESMSKSMGPMLRGRFNLNF